jgi:hypothetical protein
MGVHGSTWEYEESTMGVHGSTWEYVGVRAKYNGSTMGVHGSTSEVQREYNGSTMGVQWEYMGVHGSTMGVQWEYDGSTMGVRWEYGSLAFSPLIIYHYIGVICHLRFYILLLKLFYNARVGYSMVYFGSVDQCIFRRSVVNPFDKILD